jgi:hypothetical protein
MGQGGQVLGRKDRIAENRLLRRHGSMHDALVTLRGARTPDKATIRFSMHVRFGPIASFRARDASFRFAPSSGRVAPSQRSRGSGPGAEHDDRQGALLRRQPNCRWLEPRGDLLDIHDIAKEHHKGVEGGAVLTANVRERAGNQPVGRNSDSVLRRAAATRLRFTPFRCRARSACAGRSRPRP